MANVHTFRRRKADRNGFLPCFVKCGWAPQARQKISGRKYLTARALKIGGHLPFKFAEAKPTRTLEKAKQIENGEGNMRRQPAFNRA